MDASLRPASDSILVLFVVEKVVHAMVLTEGCRVKLAVGTGQVL